MRTADEFRERHHQPLGHLSSLELYLETALLSKSANRLLTDLLWQGICSTSSECLVELSGSGVLKARSDVAVDVERVQSRGLRRGKERREAIEAANLGVTWK